MSFKGIENVPGMVMQTMEKGGFLLSFLVQDTLGMTVPRTYEGLRRNVPEEKKNSFKDLNFKEGTEVFIREFLSGPLMMFTPVAVLLLGKKSVGKSSFTNSSMIRHLGNTFKETAAEAAGKDKEALKSDFYRRNITKIVQNTTNAADKNAEAEFIDKAFTAVETLDKYSEKIAASRGKQKRLYKKAQKQSKQNLVNMFNEFHKTHSSDYSMVNRVKTDKNTSFKTDKMIDGMRNYAADAFKNKKADDINVEFADTLQKKSLISRYIVNTAAAVSTIASTAIVPFLYKIVNPVPPGALDNTVNNPSNQLKTSEKNKEGNVSFTGKADVLARHFEYDGTQLTPALMTTLAVCGLIAPRVHTAIKRAPENPVTKEKDYSEVPEILTRDIISTGAVTFGVPMLSKAIVSSYEHKSGFALQNKPEKPMSTLKKVLDKLNPFSSHSPYSLSDLNQIYGDVNTVEKLGNFSKFIDNNNGSLAKVFNTIDKSRDVFNEYGLDIKELSAQKDRKSANKTIMEKLKNPGFAEKMLDVMKPDKKGKANNILKRARSLNSVTTFASTFFFIPAFLGVVLPKTVYGLTSKRHQKMAECTNEIIQKRNQDNLNNAKSKIDYSKLRYSDKNTTFTRLKH